MKSFIEFITLTEAPVTPGGPPSNPLQGTGPPPLGNLGSAPPMGGGGGMGGMPMGMGGGMGGMPMGMGGGMGGMGATPEEPMQLKTYDVWEVLKNILSGKPIKDDKVAPKPKKNNQPLAPGMGDPSMSGMPMGMGDTSMGGMPMGMGDPSMGGMPM